ncbi:MAG: biopolymer transporter ExbD, partial [Planctomycetota bacterium]
MFRGRPKPESNEPKLDMTPIIDVVFNLLIFFMLTMDFQEEEGTLMAHLP